LLESRPADTEIRVCGNNTAARAEFVEQLCSSCSYSWNWNYYAKCCAVPLTIYRAICKRSGSKACNCKSESLFDNWQAVEYSQAYEMHFKCATINFICYMVHKFEIG
jgi:hypothetical protein